jgi:hypothetical protein
VSIVWSCCVWHIPLLRAEPLFSAARRRAEAMNWQGITRLSRMREMRTTVNDASQCAELPGIAAAIGAFR